MTLFMLSFMAGLSGSGHCLGMCGGILTALAVANPGHGTGWRFICNICYHAGRIFTYTVLGITAGALSQAAFFSVLRPYLVWLFASANLMVIVTGLATAFGRRSWSLASLDGKGWGFMGGVLRSAAQKNTPAVFLGTGAVLGLIPCGLVYGVLITAATGGSWFQGGGMMLAFGLGTLPALLAYGQFASALSALGGEFFLRIMGLFVAMIGCVGLIRILVKTGLVAPFGLW